MRNFILLIIPMIGFSQNCENPILDQVLESDDVNQYFKIALLANIAELEYLNSCDNINYTMFVPGNDVPAESATVLATLGGELMDYISYYIYPESISFSEFTDGPLMMMDGNTTNITVAQTIQSLDVIVNQAYITIPEICACNGLIHIIDDLIWAPGVINLSEKTNTNLLYYVGQEKYIELYNKDNLPGILEIININGKTIHSSHENTTNQINLNKYKPGLYLVIFSNKKEIISKKIIIN